MPDSVAWSLGEDAGEVKAEPGDDASVEGEPHFAAPEPALNPSDWHLADMEKVVSFIEEKAHWKGGAAELAAAVGLSIAPATLGFLLNKNEEWLAFKGIVHEKSGSRGAYDLAHRLYLADCEKYA